MGTITRYDKLFIGGEWIAPQSPGVIESIDPSTEEVWAHVAEASAEDVEVAVEAAEAALRGSWTRSVTPSARGALIARLAQLMRDNAAGLATTESRDNGKPLRDTTREIQAAADWLTYFAGAADKLSGEQIPVRPDALAYTRREPVGIVAAILPWNSPISMAAWKLGPALAAGNAVVLKPAEQTPVSTVELARVIEQAGLPRGVVSVLPGYGAKAGRALTTHPKVNKIAFTGDYRTAQAIMRDASVNLKRCTFECGGKTPFIVFADADVERALNVAVASSFRSTGQSCSITSRIFVQRPIYDRFATAFATRADRIQVGDPFDVRTHIGPHTSAEQLAKTERYIGIGRESGARLLAGGSRPKGLERGYFIRPTVFADVANASRLAQEEVFGPVISLIPFDGEDDAVMMANESIYGLVGSVWTADLGRAHRVAAQVQAGLIAVNTYRATHWMLPYGGYKLSGLGRENGMDVLREYTEVKAVMVELSANPAIDDPFAA